MICERLGPLENGKTAPTSKIGQKYTKNRQNILCLMYVFLTYFCPILRVGVLSYPVGGQVFFLGPATTQNLVVKFDGEICGGVSVENASDDFPQQKKLENLLPNFAGSSPPISPKTSPTSLWKSLVLIFQIMIFYDAQREGRQLSFSDAFCRNMS